MPHRPESTLARTECEALLQAMLDHDPSLLVIIDADMRILAINRVAAGLRATDLLGTSCLDQVPPEERTRLQQTIQQVVHSGEPARFEAQGRVADGSYGHWVTQVLPVRPGAGAAQVLLRTTDITDRRRAERALQRSEAMFRALVAASSDLVFRMSPDGSDLQRLDQRDGEADTAVSLRSWLQQHIPDDERPLVLTAAERALGTPQPFVLTHRVRRADGGTGWMHSRAVPLLDDQGTIVEWVGMSSDVTERRQAQAALAASEERLRLAMDAAEEGLWDLDMVTGDCYFSPAYHAMLGYEPGSLAGHIDSARRLFHPDDADAPARSLQALHDPGHFTLRFRLRAASGGYRWIESRGKTVRRAADGTPLRAVGTHVDITDLLRREEAQRQTLADSRNLLEAALAGAELGTWDTDLTTGRSHYDERYLAMIGYAPGELAPSMQTWLDLIHPDDRPLVDDAVAAHARGETRLCEIEHRLRHKQGHWVWVLSRGKMLRNADGVPVRAVGTHLDISDRKRIATEGTALLKKVEDLIAGLGQLAPAKPPRETAPARALPVPLTARHRQVLELLAAGLTSSEIARRLDISVETANTHRRNLMRKLGVRNKAELIRFALAHGVGMDGTAA